MLTIRVAGVEMYNNSSQEFVMEGGTLLQLEHSLVSLSKWESKFEKPFLGTEDKTEDELFEYVKCMTLTPDVPDEIYSQLSKENVEDINAYINLLHRDGTITLVGAPEKPLGVSAFGLIMGRRSLSGSAIGGIAETQEMLDFCGAHGITADVEVIPIQKVNEAYERLLKSDVKYRFSIDMASLRSERVA